MSVVLVIGATRDVLRRVAYPGLVVLAFLTLMLFARDMGFRGDDWELVANRSLTDPIGLMRPFNEQWIAVPAAVFRGVFLAVGMHSYLPYLAVLLGLHILVAEAVRRLVTAASGVLAGYVAAAIVLFLGSGAENLRWAFQISMVLSAAAGLWSIHAIATGRSGRIPAALMTVSVASHAIGVAFLLACLVLASIRDRRTLVWLAIPCIAFTSWFVAFDLPAMAARSSTLAAGLASVPAFILAGGATAVGAIFGQSTAAGIILLGLAAAAAALLRRRPARPELVATAVVAFAAEYGLIALQRADFGLGSVAWSRYVYVAVPLVLVGFSAWFGNLAHVPTRWRDRLTVALAAATVLSIAGNLLSYARDREADLTYSHRARAVAAIVVWSEDVHRPASDVHIPDPVTLRALIGLHGSPTEDSLLPFVVTRVPSDIARVACLEMLNEPLDLAACEEAIFTRVGAK